MTASRSDGTHEHSPTHPDGYGIGTGVPLGSRFKNLNPLDLIGPNLVIPSVVKAGRSR
jgi:hypothetical protein